jgi:hypothetical protein
MGDCATAGDSGAIGVTVQTRDCTQRHFVEQLFQARVSGFPSRRNKCPEGHPQNVLGSVPEAFPHANPVSGAGACRTCQLCRVSSFPRTAQRDRPYLF